MDDAARLGGPAVARPDRARLDFIDGLRAVAVILVFLVHAPEAFRPVVTDGAWLLDVTNRFDTGRMGVVTFFAISGFVIPYSLHGRGRHPIAAFLIGRAFRLYPAFWLSILPSVVTLLWFFGKSITPHEILLNFTMLPRLFGAPLANGVYWTLEVETLFYGLAVLLFYGGVLDNLFVLASLMFAMFALYFTSQGVLLGGLLNPPLAGDTFYFWLHVSIILWGACIRRLYEGDRARALALLLIALYSGYWLLLRPLGALHAIGTPAQYAAVRTVAGYSVGMGLFLLAVLVRPAWNRPMLWLGRISYSFYLLHGPAMYIVMKAIASAGLGGRFPLALCAAVSFALALVLAALSFYLVERPAVRLGRALSRALDRAAAPRVGVSLR